METRWTFDREGEFVCERAKAGKKADKQRHSRKKSAKPASEIRLIPIPLADAIQPKDSILKKLIGNLRQQKVKFKSGDILIIKHKIISKSEGQIVNLSTIKPSADSIAWAKQYGLDAR